jgi:hypothetical protein
MITCPNTGRKPWKCKCVDCVAVRNGDHHVTTVKEEVSLGVPENWTKMASQIRGLSLALYRLGITASLASSDVRSLMRELVYMEHGVALRRFDVHEVVDMIHVLAYNQQGRSWAFPALHVANKLTDRWHEAGLRGCQASAEEVCAATAMEDGGALAAAVRLYKRWTGIECVSGSRLLLADATRSYSILATNDGRFTRISNQEIEEEKWGTEVQKVLDQRDNKAMRDWIHGDWDQLEPDTPMGHVNCRSAVTPRTGPTYTDKGRVSDPGDGVLVEEWREAPGSPVDRIVHIGLAHTHLRVGNHDLILHREGNQVWVDCPGGKVRLA